MEKGTRERERVDVVQELSRYIVDTYVFVNPCQLSLFACQEGVCPLLVCGDFGLWRKGVSRHKFVSTS